MLGGLEPTSNEFSSKLQITISSQTMGLSFTNYVERQFPTMSYSSGWMLEKQHLKNVYPITEETPC